VTAVLLWDIDGTLLTTARAGVFALEDAIREISGSSVDLSRLTTAGLTDYEVASTALKAAGLDAIPTLVDEFLRRYEARLPASLPKRAGCVLPGARKLLEYLRRYRPDIRSLLLTGNTRMGADAKLTYYDLQEFFGGGAFAEDGCDRVGIAHRALICLADQGIRSVPAFVIGDTPHDIRCGKAIGARTVAVATGDYSAEQLRAHSPSVVFDRLPEPDHFLQALGLPGPVAA
jgi:phosphoglycolate phosphatase-like HAD superfamily hydrolase